MSKMSRLLRYMLCVVVAFVCVLPVKASQQWIDSGYIVAEPTTSAINIASDIEPVVFIEKAQSAGAFNHLNDIKNGVDPVFSGIDEYLSFFETDMDAFKQYFYSRPHYVSTDQICPILDDSFCSDLDSATNGRFFSTSYYYLLPQRTNDCVLYYDSSIEKEEYLCIGLNGSAYNYSYSTRGAHTGISYNEILRVYESGGLPDDFYSLSSPISPFVGLTICPVGTRIPFGAEHVYENCISYTDEENPVVDIVISLPTWVFENRGINYDKPLLIIREHFGKGWTVVLYNDEENWLLDYTNSRGTLDGGNVLYNSYLDIQTILDAQTKISFYDMFLAAIKTYFEAVGGREFDENDYQELLSKIYNISEYMFFVPFDSSTGLTDNVFIDISDEEDNDIKYIWDSLPHHSTKNIGWRTGYNENNNEEPIECLAGKYFDIQQWECVECSLGHYCPGVSMLASDIPDNETKIGLEECSEGFYSNGYGATSCTECPAGTYNQNTGSESSSACLTCLAGTYSSAGSGMCSNCPSGSYSDTNGASSCKLCTDGMTSGVGSTSCDGVCPQMGTGGRDGIEWVMPEFNSTGSKVLHQCEISGCKTGYDTILDNNGDIYNCSLHEANITYALEGGSLSIDNQYKQCSYGKSFTFPAAPTKEGYRFVGWKKS